MGKTLIDVMASGEKMYELATRSEPIRVFERRTNKIRKIKRFYVTREFELTT